MLKEKNAGFIRAPLPIWFNMQKWAKSLTMNWIELA